MSFQYRRPTFPKLFAQACKATWLCQIKTASHTHTSSYVVPTFSVALEWPPPSEHYRITTGRNQDLSTKVLVNYLAYLWCALIFVFAWRSFVLWFVVAVSQLRQNGSGSSCILAPSFPGPHLPASRYLVRLRLGFLFLKKQTENTENAQNTKLRKSRRDSFNSFIYFCGTWT